MVRFGGSLLACLAAVSSAHADEAERWKPVQGQLLTRWAKDVRPDRVWPEYPRPQMVRADWLNLNGLWDYAITPGQQAAAPAQYDGEILVPFCIESALSGVKKAVQPDQALWYRRTFEVPPAWQGRRVLLHFGAVDWFASVWVNGQHMVDHQGGYDPFAADVTNALSSEGPQTVVVKVTDPTNQHWQPRGKQVLKPEGIWYTAVTGIWQTVWLEPVTQQHIRRLKITPNVDRPSVVVEADVAGGGRTQVEVTDGGRAIAKGDAAAGEPVAMPVPDAKLWSPDSPHLYDVKVSLISDGVTADTVQSYFGMRKIALGEHEGHTRTLLNGKPLFQFGPLDQGWWPDGLYTAPTDEALRYDLEVIKKLGMNMLRKHVKVESARLYYHCDRLGLLVWQDMPSGDRYIGGNDPDIDRSPESAANFERELRAMIDGLRNHPSIVMWVLYNEGWGQWDTQRLTNWIRDYDPTRLVNSASGWTDRKCGDVIDVHAYPGPAMQPAEEKRASVLGEFGGLGWPVEGHLWWNKKNWGYRTYTSGADLQENYLSVVRRVLPLIGEGLSAAVYTQTSDVEGEVNGLLTYDREVLKLDVASVVKLHRQLYAPPPKVLEVVPTSRKVPQMWRYTTEQPAADWFKPEFDDSGWRSGEGMFGTEGTPGVRLGTAWTTSDIWLRRQFRLEEVPRGDLRLHVYHDEGAEVYINGVLAGSFEQWVTSHILAEMSEEARRALKPGVNVLAVHCHQTGGGQGIDAGISAVVERPERYDYDAARGARQAEPIRRDGGRGADRGKVQTVQTLDETVWFRGSGRTRTEYYGLCRSRAGGQRRGTTGSGMDWEFEMSHHQAGVICGFMLGTVVGASSRPALGQPDDLRDHVTDSQELMRAAALRPAGLASSSAQTDPAETPPAPSTKPVVRASAQRAEHATLVFTKSVETKYLLYLPQEYDEQPEKKWPLLMHLHGVGERGDDLEKVKAHGPARYIAEGKDYPFVIVTPQCPADQWWDPDALLALLDTVTRSLRIDADRVYLTGLSMGGYGTWYTAARDPKRFAAIAPICGGGNVADAPKLVNLAIWAFHGEKDTVVPPERSKEMVDAVNQAGGRARLTLYPDAAHDSWTRTYENPELYKWLLSHRRGEPPVFGAAD